MSKEFVKEDRYLVFKIKDLDTYLEEAERLALMQIIEAVEEGRARNGKAPLECVVVESDWPEYESTWAAIEARVTAGG